MSESAANRALNGVVLSRMQTLRLEWFVEDVLKVLPLAAEDIEILQCHETVPSSTRGYVLADAGDLRISFCEDTTPKWTVSHSLLGHDYDSPEWSGDTLHYAVQDMLLDLRAISSELTGATPSVSEEDPKSQVENYLGAVIQTVPLVLGALPVNGEPASVATQTATYEDTGAKYVMILLRSGGDEVAQREYIETALTYLHS